jgi:hypothetical protein
VGVVPGYGRERCNLGTPRPPQSPQAKLGHHHNSWQRPKTRFIHNQVVRPQLLTLVSSGKPTSARGATNTSPGRSPGFGTVPSPRAEESV